MLLVLVVLLEGVPRLERWDGGLQAVQEGWGGRAVTPGTSINWERAGWPAALQEGLWGCWLAAAQQQPAVSPGSREHKPQPGVRRAQHHQPGSEGLILPPGAVQPHLEHRVRCWAPPPRRDLPAHERSQGRAPGLGQGWKARPGERLRFGLVRFGEEEAEGVTWSPSAPSWGGTWRGGALSSCPQGPVPGHAGTAQSCTREVQAGCREHFFREGGQTLQQDPGEARDALGWSLLTWHLGSALNSVLGALG